MYRRSSLNMLAAAAALGLPSTAAAQTKTLKEQLIGTWMFVVTEATQPDGKKLLLWADSPPVQHLDLLDLATRTVM